MSIDLFYKALYIKNLLKTRFMKTLTAFLLIFLQFFFAPHSDALSPETFFDPLNQLYNEISIRVEKNSEQPLIVGVAGGSGVGKSTLTKDLKKKLQQRGHRVFVLKMDSFFQYPWKRYRLQKNEKNEWGPEHVRLEEAERVLNEIAHGKVTILTDFYISETHPVLEPTEIDLIGVDIVLFEGLWALSSNPKVGNFHRFVNLSVYLEADIKDQYRWRLQREKAKEKPRSDEAFQQHWNLGILKDMQLNIRPSKSNADYVIKVLSNREFVLNRVQRRVNGFEKHSTQVNAMNPINRLKSTRVEVTL